MAVQERNPRGYCQSATNKENLDVGTATSRHTMWVNPGEEFQERFGKMKGLIKLLTECMMSSARKRDLEAIKRIDMYRRRSNTRLLSSKNRNPMVSAASSGNLSIIVWMYRRRGFAMGPLYHFGSIQGSECFFCGHSVAD